MTKVQFVMMLGFAGFMSMAGGFAATMLMGGSTVNASPSMSVGGAGETVTASKFVLMDNKGKLRGMFIVSDDGDVTFAMLDKNEKPRISQLVSDDTASVVISDRRTKPRISLTTGGREHPGAVSVFDSRERPAALLAVGENNFPLMTLTRDGKICNVMGVNKDGQSVISLSHPEGGSCNLVAGKDTPSAIELTHPANGSKIDIQAQEEGNAVIQLKTANKIRAQFMTDSSGKPRLVFADSKGTITWSQDGK